MTDLPQTSDSRPLILAACDGGLGEAVRGHLARQLGCEYDARAAEHCSEADQMLGEEQYCWLIVSENLAPAGFDATGCDRRWGPGRCLAMKWLNQTKGDAAPLEVILLTTLPWDDPCTSFPSRMSAIPKEHVILGDYCPIAEIIHAGEAGCVLVPPTVVELGLARDKSGICSLRVLGVEDGPLMVPLKGKLVYGTKCEEEISDFASFEAEFAKAAGSGAPMQRHLVVTAARKLWEALGGSTCNGVLERLEEAVTEAYRPWGDPNGRTRCDGPFPLHIHIRAEPSAMALPLDLLLPDAAGTAHLCARAPVTWRLVTTPHARPETEAEGRRNETSRDNLVAVVSCCNDPPSGSTYVSLPDAPQHAERVLAAMGVTSKGALCITERAHLRQTLVQEEGRPGMSAYVTTHGEHASPADTSAIHLGPNETDADGFERVFASHLRPKNGEQGLQFAYFNCCELAWVAAAEAAGASYFRGFADAAIAERVCTETVCNRWSVDKEYAFDLAEWFHEIRPTTAQGRAVALLRARLKLLDKMTEEEDPFEPTWLAPVHIWAAAQ